jgi:hypothetical protein
MVHHQARRISHRAFFLNADKRFIDAIKRSTMFDHVYSKKMLMKGFLQDKDDLKVARLLLAEIDAGIIPHYR